MVYGDRRNKWHTGTTRSIENMMVCQDTQNSEIKNKTAT